MKIIAFFAALLISTGFLFVSVGVHNVSADWLEGYNLARDSSNLPENYADSVILTILQWLLLIFTFLCVIAFVVAGIMFLTAGSNPPLAEQAKKAVMYSIIGVAVGLSGYVIIALIDSFMQGVVQEP
jgi:cytochrome bd-type quinol oxidase subunit 2